MSVEYTEKAFDGVRVDVSAPILADAVADEMMLSETPMQLAILVRTPEQ